jgi:S-disulfanyl-L-cysteine oxidoreductase SoxD
MRLFSRLLLGCAAGAAVLAAVAAGAALALLPAAPPPSPPSSHFADANNRDMVRKGFGLYHRSCVYCHGKRMEGDLLWQTRDQFFGRRAPPHDYSGHTWQHSDEELFHMTKFGRFSTVPPNPNSQMPAYGKYFSDDEILDVLAFIKSQWPLGLRVSQSLLNPDFEGMPASADKVDWKLPPKCLAAVQKAGSSLSFGVNGNPVDTK